MTYLLLAEMKGGKGDKTVKKVKKHDALYDARITVREGQESS